MSGPVPGTRRNCTQTDMQDVCSTLDGWTGTGQVPTGQMARRARGPAHQARGDVPVTVKVIWRYRLAEDADVGVGPLACPGVDVALGASVHVTVTVTGMSPRA